jgi:hypothetical protein
VRHGIDDRDDDGLRIQQQLRVVLWSLRSKRHRGSTGEMGSFNQYSSEGKLGQEFECFGNGG